MTHAAPRQTSKVPKIWLLPLLAVLLVVVATAIGLLSRSILIDFVAWWPLWIASLALGFSARRRRIGVIRVSGLLSLIVLGVLAGFVFAHVRGWPIMPSSVERLQGSADTDVEVSAVSARMGGELRIRPDTSGFLYTVAPLRGGGSIGVPDAVEHSQSGSVSVELIPNPDPGLYQFAGWDLTLSTKPVWNLSLRGVIDANMTALNINSLQIEGSGSVGIGEPDGISPVSVDGEFTIVLPAGVPVRVVGPADVPDGWSPFEGDIVSPTDGEGWVIAISEGSVVRIKEG